MDSTKGVLSTATTLYDFLDEVRLTDYFNELKNVLRVQNVNHLRFISDEELVGIGMSKAEIRRMKIRFQKLSPTMSAASSSTNSNNSGISKLKKFLLPTKSKQEECLIDEPTSITTPSTKNNIRVPSKHIIPAESVTIHKELGVGEFGIVQQGVWVDDEISHQVAVKCLSKERMQNNTMEFMKEYEIMQSIDHPFIVKLFGVVLDSPQIMLITELAHLRSLLECLKEVSLRSTFTVSRLSNFCCQIAEGMKYLEVNRLIHRDLAARNLLVFSKDVVKISDFGLSRALGVGKDYYQTNFNANLKLPIAWCAPECINFLKFTSASDVWAFATTMWEMFTYGFQPWAGHTGQQILEAIDEPHCQRLEQPIYCPKEHYQIMLNCWKHDPSKRPTFAQLSTVLEEARPEQVKAVVNAPPRNKTSSSPGYLNYEIGDVITVLEKSVNDPLWKGSLDNGKVGFFSPSHTVTYVGTLPTSNTRHKWQDEGFRRNSLRGSSSSSSSYKNKKKISIDMISGPRGTVQHTGHVGADGAYFGDVTGFHQSSNKFHNDFMSMPCLSRTDSDVSERAPLISDNGLTIEGANKNPRMVYATGYLRKNSAASGVEKHEYQSISEDDEELFSTPLDLGPSLMDEVFNELDSSLDSMETKKERNKDGFSEQQQEQQQQQQQQHQHQQQQQQQHQHQSHHHHKRGHELKEEIKDLVFSTLTLSRHKLRHKKHATVKPINAQDEKTLENAIAMANALASKSMHELDKRGIDDFYENSPIHSPLTPNSPSKKFTFWFPNSKSSPKNERRHFSEEVNASSNMEALFSPGAKDAYKTLIEGNGVTKMSSSMSDVHHRLSLPPTAFQPPVAAANRHRINNNNNNNNNNPLPLPPKSIKMNMPPPKRHVRKNPLIISDSPEMTFRAQTCNNNNVLNDNDFEEAIASSMDALDNIPEIPKYNSPKHSLDLGTTTTPLVQYNQDHVSCEDLLEFRRASDSDEVRIMKKVLGAGSIRDECAVQALRATEWNVHHAIKLVKIKNLIKSHDVTDTELKEALQAKDWDVVKAIHLLTKNQSL